MTDAADRARDLETWLAPFLAAMGRKTRRTWAPLYLRGLLGPGERKSLQPMATRLGLSGHDQLQHFIASPAWDDSPLWTELAREADRLVGGGKASLVIDDTALPKKGTLSVGVARQYCGQLGKKANCQSLVSLTLAQRAGSATHSSGRNRRRPTGTGTSPCARVRETRDWQFAFLPSWPQYCRATPTDRVPFLGRAVSSITREAFAPPTSRSASRASSAQRGLSSQAGLAMKCCS